MQQYIIGNWKMNGTKEEAQKLASGFLKRIQEAKRALPKIILCPSYPYLTMVIDILKGSPIEVGAQDVFPEKSGSYTGDVSIAQLVDIGCKYVIVGHSERRQHHQEKSILIRKKCEVVIKEGVRPILCIGESEEERKSGKALHAITYQLEHDLPQSFEPHEIIIAYEPLWAIGTGHLPSLDDIEEVMGLIKHELSSRLSGGGLVPILYGGSVTSQNAAALLDLPHVDGLLVGGASLKLDDFWEVINASER
jgi:triosephosphate isomerase